YVTAYHSWALEELVHDDRLIEFYVLLRPQGLLDLGKEPIAQRAFRETISAGRDITDGFYGLYKAVQAAVLSSLLPQSASKSLSAVELEGKAHKLLNRILFIAFAEKHSAQLVPPNTLRQVVLRARANGKDGAYWREYKRLFQALNVGG